jgi:hypothetical protein
MKRFFITTLLCAATLNAMTKEHVEAQGYYQNWEKNNKDLIVTDGKTPLFTIDKSHVPANEELPYAIKIYFPVPSQNFLQNSSSIFFETDGTFEEGTYIAPEKNPLRFLWSKIKDSKGTVLTVPTARLMILLKKQQLEEAGYQENWKERSDNLTITTSKGTKLTIDKNHVPALKRLNKETEVYFPVPVRNYLQDKEDIEFVTNGAFKRGHFYKQETDGSRSLWSIVEDDNEKRYAIPTARLMINRLLLREITSPFKETI